jgi:quercetin dioxygenase-like cupin family protein
MTGQVIHDDARGVVAELAFGPRAMIAPHSNPNTTLFIVIGGGGWVQVGEERSRVNQGEAVVWPAGIEHGAYTEGSEMRAIVVELAGADDRSVRSVLEGRAAQLPAEAGGAPAEARGAPADVDRSAAAPGALESAGAPRADDGRMPADRPPTPAEGALAERVPTPEEYDRSTGEPW